MSHPVTGIDHCFVLTDDLDAAARQYAALGFTLSPRGEHSKSKGSANYTIMFPDDYLELLGIIAETEGNAGRRASLRSQGRGLHAIACRIRDAEAAARELAALCIATEGLGSFERPVPLPGGGSGTAAFSTVSFAPEEVPVGSVFMCQHRTPETVWLPELLTHPNTATGLDTIFAVSAAREEDAARMARLWAEGSVRAAEGLQVVSTGRHSARVALGRREAIAALYPDADLERTPTGAFTALRLRVADLEAARSCIAAAGVSAFPTAAGLAVAPEHAAGAILEFVAP